MNALKLKNWSERQQVLAFILMVGAVVFALCFFLLLPLNRRRANLEKDIEGMRSQLALKNYLLGEEALLQKRRAEQEAHARISEEWTLMAERLGAFANQKDFAESQVGNIDYKVALYDIRQRLHKKSTEMKVRLLPDDLGMEDAVRSNEDARKLMLQLRTVEKLVNLTLDLNINTLRMIEPLPPIRHESGNGKEVFLEEYPVRMEFYGTLANLYELFHAVLDPKHVFVFKRLRVETMKPAQDLLSIDTVLSALLFPNDPEDMAAAKAVVEAPAEPRRPMGY